MMSLDEKLDRNFKLSQEILVKIEDLLAKVARVAEALKPALLTGSAAEPPAAQTGDGDR